MTKKKEGAILGSDVLPGLGKKAIRIDTKELGQELEKLRNIPASGLVVKTGVKEYGFPADAKERRM